MNRRGFALLVVLWMLSAIAVFGALLTRTGRGATAAVRNRLDLVTARWADESCLARLRAKIDERLSAVSVGDRIWGDLDSVVTAAGPIPGCTVRIVCDGIVANVNDLTPQQLGALLARLHTPPARIDSLVAALVDWRDADDSPETKGAEADWYFAHQRPGPRNGPLQSPEELRLVRGFESFSGIDSVLGTEPTRIVVERAPLAVIASLPGVTDELIDRLAEFRGQGARVADLSSMGRSLSALAAATLAANATGSDILRGWQYRVAPHPEGWVVAISSTPRPGGPTATVEVVLYRVGRRTVIGRRRSWT